MKNIILTIVIICAATLFVKADFFPIPGSYSTYEDNGTGLDINVGIYWGSNTGEFADGFVVTIDGIEYISDLFMTGAWGNPDSDFFGAPSGSGLIPAPPFSTIITIPYPAGWAAGDPVDVLLAAYGDAAGDDPTGINSFFVDEPVQSSEAPPLVEVSCATGETNDFYSAERGLGFGIVSSTQPFNLIAADDFNVGSSGLLLNGVLANGAFYIGNPVITDVNVIIYADNAGSPGAPICSYTETPLSASGPELGLISVQFSSPCALTMGNYWISVQVNANDLWVWYTSEAVQGAEAVNRDVDGTFSDNTDWEALSEYLMSAPSDFTFTLYSCEEAPVLVPTLSQWGIITLVLLITIFGVIQIALPSVKNSLATK